MDLAEIDSFIVDYDISVVNLSVFLRVSMIREG